MQETLWKKYKDCKHSEDWGFRANWIKESCPYFGISFDTAGKSCISHNICEKCEDYEPKQ